MWHRVVSGLGRCDPAGHGPPLGAVHQASPRPRRAGARARGAGGSGRQQAGHVAGAARGRLTMRSAPTTGITEYRFIMPMKLLQLGLRGGGEGWGGGLGVGQGGWLGAGVAAQVIGPRPQPAPPPVEHAHDVLHGGDGGGAGQAPDAPVPARGGGRGFARRGGGGGAAVSGAAQGWQAARPTAASCRCSRAALRISHLTVHRAHMLPYATASTTACGARGAAIWVVKHLRLAQLSLPPTPPCSPLPNRNRCRHSNTQAHHDAARAIVGDRAPVDRKELPAEHRELHAAGGGRKSAGRGGAA
jgi:hypothetical protein